MSRERFIDPKFFISPDVYALTDFAKLVFVGLFTLADDHGRGKVNPKCMRLQLGILSKHSEEDFEKSLSEIASQGMVDFYKIDDEVFYSIPKFNRYQYIRYKARSKLPDSGEICTNSVISGEIWRNLDKSGEIAKLCVQEGRGDDDDDGEDDESSSPDVFVSSSPSLSESKIPTQENQEDGKILGQHVAYWNEHVATVLKAPTVRILSEKRLRCLRKRLEEHPNLWQEILDEFPRLEEKFRKGASWINFDFFMSPDRLARYLDGNYRPRGSI